MSAPAPRRLLFHRDFDRYSGGHGKVWDYFNHAAAHPLWTPRVYLTPASRDEENPWRRHHAPVATRWAPDEDADALLLGGVDWRAYPHDHSSRPVINLVQGVRHGDPADARHRFLRRRAVRICVSDQIAEAIADAVPNGPVLVIRAGLALPTLPQTQRLRSGVFVDALKQPQLGRALAGRLAEQGIDVQWSDRRLPRDRYLARLAQARIAVTLPGPSEGFYLPGLEAMALGCASVVPDAVGNRVYLQPGLNALSPPMQLDALVAAVVRLDAEPALAARLAAAGPATASGFGIDREREAFLRVLDDLDRLWRD